MAAGEEEVMSRNQTFYSIRIRFTGVSAAPDESIRSLPAHTVLLSLCRPRLQVAFLVCIHDTNFSHCWSQDDLQLRDCQLLPDITP